MAELRYVDWDGLVYYDGKVKDYINNKFEDSLKFGGSIIFENIPRPCFQNLNFIYRIVEKFTSNEDFEIPGCNYLEGTMVQVTDINGEYQYTIFSEPSSNNSIQLEDKIEEIEEAIEELESSVGRNTANVMDQDRRLNDLEANVEAVNDTVDTLDAKADQLETRIQQLEVQSPANCVTKEEFNTTMQQYVTNQTLEEKNYVTETYVSDTYVTQQVADSTYVTVPELQETVASEVQKETVEIIKQEVTTQIAASTAAAVSYGSF